MNGISFAANSYKNFWEFWTPLATTPRCFKEAHYASICNFYRQERPRILLGKSWDIFRKVFPPQFLARALALQSVAFRQLTARPKTCAFFCQNFFLNKICLPIFFTKIFLTYYLFLYKKKLWDHLFSTPTIPIVPN